MSEKEYNELKALKDVNNPLTAFAGFGCSFGARYFAGYARAIATNRNYALEAHQNLLRETKKLLGVQWTFSDYSDLEIPPNSVIYCDPPYSNTTEYIGVKTFDANLFWDWCAKKHQDGHAVFISEYSAPPNFECRLEIKKTLGLKTKDGNRSRIDKVFVYRGADYGLPSHDLLNLLDLQ